MQITAKRLWVFSLLILPLAGILLATTWQWHSHAEGEKIDSTTEPGKPEVNYEYSFVPASASEITNTLNQEISFYQQRIQRNPDSGLDRSALARSYLKMAQLTGESKWYSLAEQSAQQSLANLPFDNQGAVMIMARLAQAKHNFPEAIKLAEQILASSPDSEDALSILVTANLAMGDVAAAAQASDALVRNIATLGSLTLQASVQTARGEDEVALETFQAALAAEEPGEVSSSAKARSLLGRFYMQRGEHDLAKQLYKEALRIFPDYPLALLHLAELELKEGEYEAAKEHYLKIVDTNLDHDAFQGLASIAHLQDSQQEAEKLWHQAEHSLRDHHDLSDFGHHRDLARLLLTRGNPQDLPEALALMEKELEIRRDAETLDTLAWASSNLGRYEKAQQTIEEALLQGVRDAKLFYRAATIEQKLGNKSQAQEYLQLAHETDPNFNERSRQLWGLVGIDN